MRNLIDKILVGLVYCILGIQILGSLAIFVNSIYSMIKKRFMKKNSVRHFDHTQITSNRLVKE